MHPLFLAAVSGESLVSLLVWVVIVCLIWFVISWVLGQVPIPEPARTVVRVVMALILGVILINALLTVAGHGFISW